MNIKLLPCPFCGKDAEFQPYKNNGLTLKCKTFNCVSRSQRVLRYSLEWLQDKMNEQWNTRQQLARQPSLQAQINTLNDAITEDKILVAYTKQLESSNNELVEALREISQVNHSSAKCNDIAKNALQSYEAKPINESKLK